MERGVKKKLKCQRVPLGQHKAKSRQEDWGHAACQRRGGISIARSGGEGGHHSTPLLSKKTVKTIHEGGGVSDRVALRLPRAFREEGGVARSSEAKTGKTKPAVVCGLCRKSPPQKPADCYRWTSGGSLVVVCQQANSGIVCAQSIRTRNKGLSVARSAREEGRILRPIQR
jgi:hypothetical protein